jgi:hypothetical protein
MCSRADTQGGIPNYLFLWYVEGHREDLLALQTLCQQFKNAELHKDISNLVSKMDKSSVHEPGGNSAAETENEAAGNSGRA